jgi:hypothetical protein
MSCMCEIQANDVRFVISLIKSTVGATMNHDLQHSSAKRELNTSSRFDSIDISKIIFGKCFEILFYLQY